jgi:His-Xaa-Ser system radical SAM maturase HxsC
VGLNLEIIRLIEPEPEYIGITGGEPTLLGDGLFSQLQALRDRLKKTHIHILSNGRRFAWPDFAKKLAEIRHPALSLGIPVYSDNASDHDYIVQAHGAFDQTMMGLYRLAEHGVNIEIRVVLHAQTVGRLKQLVEFIYRNIPFANHIALMGLEITGYTPHNLPTLWIDPFDYREDLLRAASYLINRGMNVSIYNHQLCVLDRKLWPFARRSISDWKNIYIDACELCIERSQCGGLFQSAVRRHSAYIRPIA